MYKFQIKELKFMVEFKKKEKKGRLRMRNQTASLNSTVIFAGIVARCGYHMCWQEHSQFIFTFFSIPY